MKTANLTRFKAKYFLIFLIFVFAVGKTFAQDNLEFLAEQINRGNSEQKRSALFQIRNLETAEASQAAIPALKDADEIVRATAASAIVFLSSEDAAVVLLPLLRDKKPFVRKEAAYALGKTRNNSAVRPLIEIIQKDKIQEVKDAATVALGEIGDLSAIDALIRILQRSAKTNEEFRRRSAARSLGQIAKSQKAERLAQIKNSAGASSVSPKEFRINLSREISDFQNAVKILSQILQASNEADDVKREAAFALGIIGDSTAVPFLRKAIDSKDYYLAENSRQAIEKIELNNFK